MAIPKQALTPKVAVALGKAIISSLRTLKLLDSENSELDQKWLLNAL